MCIASSGEVHMSAVRRAIHAFSLVLSVMGLAPAAPALADSVPFWGAKASVPIDTPINQLKKGEFLWMGEAVSTGPVAMVVSITEQRAYVYRNGILIGATTVSTGRPGHLTPTGSSQSCKRKRSIGRPFMMVRRCHTWSGSLGMASHCMRADCPVIPNRTAAFTCRASLPDACSRFHPTA